jgi:putative NADH-flavin reductase
MESLSTIAVIGATGTAGSRVVARLKARGVAVVEISRAHGVDLISGQGLSRAL